MASIFGTTQTIIFYNMLLKQIGKKNAKMTKTYFQLFLDCFALCSDWSAILCDLCNWCNCRVFNFMAHVSSSHGCCWNNIILYNAVSSNIPHIVKSNFKFLPHQTFYPK